MASNFFCVNHTLTVFLTCMGFCAKPCTDLANEQLGLFHKRRHLDYAVYTGFDFYLNSYKLGKRHSLGTAIVSKCML